MQLWFSSSSSSEGGFESGVAPPSSGCTWNLPSFLPKTQTTSFTVEHRKSARAASLETQITGRQSFEVRLYCANDANKANDKDAPLFSFHVSQRNKNSILLPKDSVGSTLISDSVLFRFENLRLLLFFSFFCYHKKGSEQRGKAGRGLFGVRNTFQRLAKKQPAKSEMKPANKAAHCNK